MCFMNKLRTQQRYRLDTPEIRESGLFKTHLRPILNINSRIDLGVSGRIDRRALYTFLRANNTCKS